MGFRELTALPLMRVARLVSGTGFRWSPGRDWPAETPAIAQRRRAMCGDRPGPQVASGCRWFCVGTSWGRRIDAGTHPICAGRQHPRRRGRGVGRAGAAPAHLPPGPRHALGPRMPDRRGRLRGAKVWSPSPRPPASGRRGHMTKCPASRVIPASLPRSDQRAARAARAAQKTHRPLGTVTTTHGVLGRIAKNGGAGIVP